MHSMRQADMLLLHENLRSARDMSRVLLGDGTAHRHSATGALKRASLREEPFPLQSLCGQLDLIHGQPKILRSLAE